MKIKFPLYAQMASLLVLHFALLVLLIAVFFNTPFGPGWNAIFQSPLGDKVETIAWTIQKQTESHPQSEWNEILEQFGQIYGAKFYVFDCLGKQQGGQPVKLPEPVQAQFTRPGGAPPNFVFHAGPSLAPAIMIDTAGGVTNIGAGPPPFVMLQEGPVHPDGKAHTHAPARGAQVRAFALTGPAGLGPAGMAPPGQEWMPPPMPPPFAGDGPPPPESAGADLGSDIGTVTAPAPPFGPPDWHHPGPHPGVRTLVHTKDPDRFWVVIKQPVVDMSRHFMLPGALIAQVDNLWQTRIFIDLAPVAIGMAAVLLFSILFWFPFAYKLTRALTTMTAATNKIAEGRFDTRVQGHRIDELGALGESVNILADRLNTFVNDEKRFMGDIAHELCSPIARLQVALELIHSDGSAEQEKVIEDIREEVTEMSDLINELLAFSKASLQGKEIELTPIGLLDLLEDVSRKVCCESLVKLNVSDKLKVMGDDLLLHRAFANIFRNEVRYAGGDGPIEVVALRSGDQIIVTTTDNGPGVSEEAIKRLGEPFFRPERSRSRSSGGVGLGLAIVRTCIQACNGSFLIRNRVPRGLEIEIRLPVALPN